jgi:hypothetical protein
MRTITGSDDMFLYHKRAKHRTSAFLPLATILVLACGPAAHAQGIAYKTGNDLLESLRQGSGLEHAYALNYMAGVVDTANGSATREGFCFDLKQQSPKASQIADVVKPFLEKNPQMRERTGAVLVAAALAEVWPCK